MGQSLAEIAGKYHLSLAPVHAAMTFYYDHQAEIDQRTAESAALAAVDRLKQPSLLQAKLDEMKNG